MAYIDTQTGAYPLSEADIRRNFPNASFSAVNFAPPEGTTYELVVEVTKPTFNAFTEKLVEGDPIQVDGHWQQVWTVVALTQAEMTDIQLKIQETVVGSVQKRLDDFAKSRGYDGILSACTYANSAVTKFATEGAYCLGARDQTWAKLYQILADVQAGNWPTAGAGQTPSGYADIQDQLPQLIWPA